LLLDDIMQVIYAPKKAFKSIASNPKYLGALIILLLFVGIQIGYEYLQFSKTYTEQTSPVIYFNGPALVDELPNFINATNWTCDNNVNLTNNVDDPFNYSIYLAGFGVPPTLPEGYYSIFGNSSLQLEATNTDSVMAALADTQNVDCSASGFQNLSVTIKQVSPQTAPLTASVILYSLGDANYYTYDLTSLLSNQSTLSQWSNLTITIGPNSQGWTESGNPTWSNITSLVLNFSYPAGSDVTMRIGALYFHGLYLTPVSYGSLGLVIQFLQVFPLQFIFAWFVFTAIIYGFCRLVKNAVLWKPLFILLGFAMMTMVIRAIVNLAGALVLQSAYYPFDLSMGVRFDPFAALYFPPEAVSALTIPSQGLFNSVDSATSLFRGLVTVMAFVSYIWLGALGTLALGELKPEFSMQKRIVFSAASLGVTVLVLLFLVGIV